MQSYEITLRQLGGTQVLDVATGRGTFLNDLAGMLPELKSGIGIDRKAAAVRSAARNSLDSRLSFHIMDAAHLAFAHDSFDVVAISNSLHHLPDLQTSLQEMFRVLKPGGTLIVDEMVSDGLTETQLTHRDLHHWWAAVDRARGVDHFQTFSRSQIQSMLASLPIDNWQTFELTGHLANDPHDPETISFLDSVFTDYFAVIDRLPEDAYLRKRGQYLQKRLHRIGLHWATGVLWLGKKH